MSRASAMSASEFKARCLEVLDRVSDRTLARVAISKRGKVVGVLMPPDDDADAVHALHGFMRGSVFVPEDVDLTAPVLDESFGAADGTLHA